MPSIVSAAWVPGDDDAIEAIASAPAPTAADVNASWNVQASFTGDLDVHDIVGIKLKNDAMLRYQPKNNWLGSADRTDLHGAPRPFGERSRGAARDFNMSLLHERFGRAKLEQQRKREEARKARALKAKIKREREAAEAAGLGGGGGGGISSGGSSSKKKGGGGSGGRQWSPMEAYNASMGIKRAQSAPAGGRRAVVGGGRAAPKAELGCDEVTSAFRHSVPAAPAYSLGGKLCDPASKSRGPGAIYHLGPSDAKTSRYTRPPAHAMAGKLLKGGFLDALMSKKGDGGDHIGLSHCDVDSTEQDHSAKPRSMARGKPFGVRHTHLNESAKTWWDVGHHDATEAFNRTQKRPGGEPRSILHKLLDPQEKLRQEDMPGPGMYRQYRTVAEAHPTYADGRSTTFGVKLPSALDPNPDMANVAPGHVGAPPIDGCSRYHTAPRFSFAPPRTREAAYAKAGAGAGSAGTVTQRRRKKGGAGASFKSSGGGTGKRQQSART